MQTEETIGRFLALQGRELCGVCVILRQVPGVLFCLVWGLVLCQGSEIAKENGQVSRTLPSQ